MNIREIVVKFIQDNFLKGNALQILDESSFLDEGIIDSVGVIELVAFLENTFNFRVEDEEIIPENLDSIKNIVNYVKLKLKCSNL